MHRAITTRTRSNDTLSVSQTSPPTPPGRSHLCLIPREQVRRAKILSHVSPTTCSKFHSSCALISCETLPLPPADASLLAFAPLRNRLCIPRGSRSCRPAKDIAEVIAPDPRPTFGPTYVGNYCHVCVLRCSAMSNSIEISLDNCSLHV